MSEPFSLGEVADRLAIEDMYARYVFAVDDQEYDVLDSIFLPDATIDWTSAGNIKADWSLAKAIIAKNNDIYVHCYHFTGNYRIQFYADRTEARVKSKTFHPVGSRNETGGVELFQVLGGYSDLLIKTQDGWRIKERVWNHGWISGGFHPIDASGGPLKK